MTSPSDASAVTRKLIEERRDAAEARLMNDPPRGLVPDAAGGDPIPWDDDRREDLGNAAEHRGD